MSTFARNMRRVLLMYTGRADGLISHLIHLGCVVLALAEVAIHRDLAKSIPLHQRSESNTLCPQGAEFISLLWRQRFRASKMHPCPLCLGNAFPLAFRTQFQLKLGDHQQHAEQQATERRVGVHLLLGSRHQGKAKARRPSPPPAWHGIDSFWIARYWLILDISC